MYLKPTVVFCMLYTFTIKYSRLHEKPDCVRGCQLIQKIPRCLSTNTDQVHRSIVGLFFVVVSTCICSQSLFLVYSHQGQMNADIRLFLGRKHNLYQETIDLNLPHSNFPAFP